MKRTGNVYDFTGLESYFTFNHIHLSKGEAYTLGHIFNVCLQLSFWQRSKLVKERSNVVSIDCDKHLRTQEKTDVDRLLVQNDQPKCSSRVTQRCLFNKLSYWLTEEHSLHRALTRETARVKSQA